MLLERLSPFAHKPHSTSIKHHQQQHSSIIWFTRCQTPTFLLAWYLESYPSSPHHFCFSSFTSCYGRMNVCQRLIVIASLWIVCRWYPHLLLVCPRTLFYHVNEGNELLFSTFASCRQPRDDLWSSRISQSGTTGCRTAGCRRLRLRELDK
jgi:hypothetical protein